MKADRSQPGAKPGICYGEQKRESGGPRWGPEAEPQWVSGGETGDMLNIRLNKIHKYSKQQK